MTYKPPPDYHSAMRATEYTSEKRQSYTGLHGCAFAWDIAKGIPEQMAGEQVDVIYTEPPWRQGYELFMKRAEAPELMPWRGLICLLGKEVRRIGKPTAIVTTKTAVAALSPDRVMRCNLNGFPDAVLCEWGDINLEADLTNEEVITRLAQRFRCVGDPCCGYGYAGQIFVRHGKRFVLSDVNPYCVGFIASKSDSWAVRQ